MHNNREMQNFNKCYISSWFPSLFSNIILFWNHFRTQVLIIRIQTPSRGFIYFTFTFALVQRILEILSYGVIRPLWGFLHRQPVNQSRVCKIKTICEACHPSASFVCHLGAEWAWMRVNYGWQETASSDADAVGWLMRLPGSLGKMG